jgi:hypothetical protein
VQRHAHELSAIHASEPMAYVGGIRALNLGRDLSRISRLPKRVRRRHPDRSRSACHWRLCLVRCGYLSDCNRCRDTRVRPDRRPRLLLGSSIPAIPLLGLARSGLRERPCPRAPGSMVGPRRRQRSASRSDPACSLSRQRVIPRSSRRRPPGAPADTRESPQDEAWRLLLTAGIPAYPRPARKQQDRPVTPEVAGSSPVAPVKALQIVYVIDISTAGFFFIPRKSRTRIRLRSPQGAGHGR